MVEPELIHCDIALLHTALLVQQFLASKNLAVVLQPLYLSDLASYESFFFFRRMKSQL